MRKLLGWIFLVCWCAFCLSLGDAATASKKKAPAKKSASKASPSSKSRKAPPKSVSASKSTRKAPPKRGAKRAPATTWRNRQMAPTPERYREIQQALASKGYLKPEDATGVWNQDSMDALRRFQTDQKIDSTGKINSLSLIALGLGPKREPLAPGKPLDVPPAPPDR